MINGIKDFGNYEPSELEIGQIRTGKKGSNGYPKKLDHFIIVDSDKHKPLPISDKLPDKPKRLGITLAHDDINKNFLNYYAFYHGFNKLACRGDGEKAVWQKGEARKKIRCNTAECKYYQQKNGCKISGLLKCSLQVDPRIYGAYFFRTTSYYTTKRILDSLKYISNITNGILAGLNLDLVLKEEKNKNGNMYIAHIEYKGSIKELQREAIELAQNREKLKNPGQQIGQVVNNNAVTIGQSEDNTSPGEAPKEIPKEEMITDQQRKDIFVMVDALYKYTIKSADQWKDHKKELRQQFMKDFSANQEFEIESLSDDSCTKGQAEDFKDWLKDKCSVLECDEEDCDYIFKAREYKRVYDYCIGKQDLFGGRVVCMKCQSNYK